MTRTNALLPIEMIHFDGLDLIPGTYQVVNEMGFDHSCNYINIKNTCKNDIFISFDGVTDHDHISAWDRLDIYTMPRLSKGEFRKYTNVYVRGPVSIGTIYVSAYGQPVIV